MLRTSKLKDLETRINEISKQNLNSSKNYNAYNLGVNSFREWTMKIHSLRNPDMVRNALYYIFQPLYDRLVESPRRFSDNSRPNAISVMAEVYEISLAYLSSYYSGKPNIRMFQERINPLLTTIAAFDKEVNYHTKHRNMSDTSLGPLDVQSFIVEYGEKILDNKLPFPNLVLGIACGSSEITFAMASVLSTGVDFVRYSKRRDDRSVKIVPEIHHNLPIRIRNNIISVVEDFVCSGGSMNNVMGYVEKYRPKEVIGVSVKENSSFGGLNKHIKKIFDQSRFHAYKR